MGMGFDDFCMEGGIRIFEGSGLDIVGGQDEREVVHARMADNLYLEDVRTLSESIATVEVSDSLGLIVDTALWKHPTSRSSQRTLCFGDTTCDADMFVAVHSRSPRAAVRFMGNPIKQVGKSAIEVSRSCEEPSVNLSKPTENVSSCCAQTIATPPQNLTLRICMTPRAMVSRNNTHLIHDSPRPLVQ